MRSAVKKKAKKKNNINFFSLLYTRLNSIGSMMSCLITSFTQEIESKYIPKLRDHVIDVFISRGGVTISWPYRMWLTIGEGKKRNEFVKWRVARLAE